MKVLIILSFLLSINSFAESNFSNRNSSQPSVRSSKSRSFIVGLSLGSTFSNEAQFTSWTHTDPSAKIGGFGNLRFDSTSFVDIKVGRLGTDGQHHWVGLRYFGDKKQNYRSTRGGNGANVTTINYSGSDVPTLQSTEIYYNFSKRLYRYYLAAGLHYSAHNYKEVSTYTGSVSATGGFGYQICGGWYLLGDAIAIDFTIKKQTLKLTFTDPTTSSVDSFEDGTLNSAEIALVIFL